MVNDDEPILLGHITRAFGIEGGVVVKLINSDSVALFVGKSIVLKPRNGESMQVTIRAIMNGGRIFFEEITDRDKASVLKGAELWINRADLPSLADDEFYLSDLMSARVVDMHGELLGHVVGFSSNGPQVLLEIATTSGHQALLPLVVPIVQRIDLANKMIIIDPPTGLLDPMD